MSKKLTLEEKLARRKFHRPNRFLYDFLCHFVVFPFLEPKYNVHYQYVDKIKKEKGPCFLIFNHQSRIDYVWAIRSAYPKRLNFVVGYNEFLRSHLHFILKIANVIPKKNFTLDMPAMRGIDTIIKKKGVIAFSPEGMSSISGHSQPVVSATGKLFKHYGIPVYILKSKGAFLTNTKVCLDERKGRIDCTLSKLFTPEDLAKLTPEEIDLKTNEALWQDDYEWNLKENIPYKNNGNLAYHMPDLLYRCPKCGKEFTMVDEGNKLYCSSCGNGALLDDTYKMHPLHEGDKLPSTPSRWFDEERKEVYREIKNNPDFAFEFDAKIGMLPKYSFLKDMKTSELVGEGRVRIDHHGFHYKGNRNNDYFSFDLDYRNLPTLGMPTDTSYFSLYNDGDYYDIMPKTPVVGKVLLIVEEMHRLHENTWKNFPWMDWVYQED